jgi:hypothetical protein
MTTRTRTFKGAYALAKEIDWETAYEEYLPRVFNFFRYRVGAGYNLEGVYTYSNGRMRSFTVSGGALTSNIDLCDWSPHPQARGQLSKIKRATDCRSLFYFFWIACFEKEATVK